MAPHLPAMAFGARPAPAFRSLPLARTGHRSPSAQQERRPKPRGDRIRLQRRVPGWSWTSGDGLEAGDPHACDPRVDRLIGYGLTAGRCDSPGDREPAADLVRPVAGQL